MSTSREKLFAIMNKVPYNEHTRALRQWIINHPDEVEPEDVHNLYVQAIFKNDMKLFRLLNQFPYDFQKYPDGTMGNLLYTAAGQIRNSYYWDYLIRQGADPFYIDPVTNSNGFHEGIERGNLHVLEMMVNNYPVTPIKVDFTELKRMYYATVGLYSHMPTSLLRGIARRLKEWGYKLPYHRNHVAEFGQFDSDPESEYDKPEYDDIY